jgi:hypothetical protein
MAITTLDGYLGAFKQRVTIAKTNSVTTVAGQPSTTFDRAGFPAAGALNPNQITNGLVPTDATTGYPTIQAFNGSNKGYITRVEATWPVAGSLAIYDVLFETGQVTIPTSGTTVTSLTSQPSYATRVPYKSDGTNRDYTQCELWARPGSVAWSNHAHSVTVTYVDQDNNTAEATANLSTQNIIINRLIRVPLNAQDNGVRQINSFTLNGVTSAAGNVVIAVMRPLWMGRIYGPGGGQWGPDQTGMPEVFADSALLLVTYADSTSSSTPSVQIEIAEG